jgi:hypothetical protein
MKPSLTDTLCTRCGLCCDGTLFADVELAGRAEATRLEVLGLEIEDDDGRGQLLVQPCAALHGTRCTVYAHRPSCCRTFECRLLQDVRRGAVSVEEAGATIVATLELVRRAKALLVELAQEDARLPLVERVAEALADEAEAKADVTARRAKLAATMASLRTSIERSFLAGSGSGASVDRR